MDCRTVFEVPIGMSQLIIGLTGGIGSGKSTVADKFNALGIDTIDADIIAREVVMPGMPAYEAMISYFGKAIVSEDGQLDRGKLRQLVFSDEEKKTWLNNLLHPIIREEMISQCRKAKSDYCLLAIPLLVENQLFNLVDQVLVIDVEEEIQLARAAKRDNSQLDGIRKIMASQVSRNERLKHADQIIDNNGSSRDLDEQVKKLDDFYIKLAKKQTKA